MAQSQKITLYALSTCPYCHRAQAFMEQRHIEFNPVFVDLLTGADKARAVEEVQAVNPRLSFPTIVIGDGTDREVLIGMSDNTEQALLKV